FQHMVKNADESGWILPYQFQRSLALRSCPHLHHVALPPPNSERQSYPISALDWVQVWNNDTRTQAVDPVHHDLRGRVLPSTLQDDDRLWDRKQNPRNSRRNVLPTERIDWPLVMRREHLTCALIELMQITHIPSRSNGVFHRPPEAFYRIEVVTT